MAELKNSGFCSVYQVLSLPLPCYLTLQTISCHIKNTKIQHSLKKNNPVESSELQFSSQLPLISTKVPFKWECLEECVSPGWY